MKGLWVPAASSMAEASSSSECPATSTRAKPRINRRTEQARCPRNCAVPHPNEQRQERRRTDRTGQESQHQLRVDIETDVVLDARTGAQAGHRLQERLGLRHRVGPEEHPAGRDDQQACKDASPATRANRSAGRPSCARGPGMRHGRGPSRQTSSSAHARGRTGRRRSPD